MNHVEEYAGVGDLSRQGEVLRQVRYRITRYQALSGNGLPIPGLHRVEGAIELGPGDDFSTLIGTPLALRLEDGRALAITIASADGRVLSEGHGPSRCLCC